MSFAEACIPTNTARFCRVMGRDWTGGLTISDPPIQAQVQALRDACEELADDVRALSTLVVHVPGEMTRLSGVF